MSRAGTALTGIATVGVQLPPSFTPRVRDVSPALRFRVSASCNLPIGPDGWPRSGVLTWAVSQPFPAVTPLVGPHSRDEAADLTATTGQAGTCWTSAKRLDSETSSSEPRHQMIGGHFPECSGWRQPRARDAGQRGLGQPARREQIEAQAAFERLRGAARSSTRRLARCGQGRDRRPTPAHQPAGVGQGARRAGQGPRDHHHHLAASPRRLRPDQVGPSRHGRIVEAEPNGTWVMATIGRPSSTTYGSVVTPDRESGYSDSGGNSRVVQRGSWVTAGWLCRPSDIRLRSSTRA